MPRAAAVMLFQSEKVVSRGYVKLKFHRTKNSDLSCKLKLINRATSITRSGFQQQTFSIQNFEQNTGVKLCQNFRPYAYNDPLIEQCRDLVIGVALLISFNLKLRS